MEGACKLCLEHKQLQRSHLMPAAIYKKLRGPNGQPIVVDRAAKTSIAINHQLCEHMLCANCEQLFHRYGENDVMRWCPIGNSEYTFRNALHKITPFDVVGDVRFWAADQLTSHNAKEVFTYFAASVFWRNSVSSRPNNSYQGKLGRIYENILRIYLLDPKNAPKRFLLSVQVQSSGKIADLAFPPFVHRFQGDYMHAFMIPGMRFSAIIGLSGSVGAADKWPMFCDWDYWNSPTHEAMIEMVAGTTRKGRLARQNNRSVSAKKARALLAKELSGSAAMPTRESV